MFYGKYTNFKGIFEKRIENRNRLFRIGIYSFPDAHRWIKYYPINPIKPDVRRSCTLKKKKSVNVFFLNVPESSCGLLKMFMESKCIS